MGGGGTSVKEYSFFTPLFYSHHPSAHICQAINILQTDLAEWDVNESNDEW